MASGGIYEELSDIISCDVCFELLAGRRPRMLNCLHVFCEDCLEYLLNDVKAKNLQNSTTIRCPVCTQQTQVSGGSAASLPLFFYASKVDNVRKEVAERHKVCKMCRTDTHKANISSYCFVCVCGHCEACHIKHDKIYQNHAQISIAPSAINYIMCEKHDAYFGHFCMTCQKAICSQCYVSQHCDHKVYDLTYDKQRVQNSLKAFFLKGLDSADVTLENLVKLETKVSEDIKKTMEEMTRHRDYLVKQINDQFESLCLELRKKGDDIKDDLAESKKLVENARISIERLITETESWYEPVKGVPEGRIINLDQLIADIKKEMPPTSVDVQPQRVKFVGGDGAIEFGDLMEEALKSPVLGLSCSFEGPATKAVQSLGICVKPTSMWQIETKARDIAYLDDGRLAVCSQNGLCVYDDSGCMTSHYLGKVCRPSHLGAGLWSVSVCREVYKVVVAEYKDWNSVGYLHVYTPDGETWQSERYNVCKVPWCVGATNSGGYVIYSGEGKLYKYDSTCKQLWCVDMPDDVYDVFVDDDDMAFVCLNHNIQVYDKKGQVVSSLSTSGQQIEPNGVCVAKCGQILVCDEENKNISLFDQNYQLIRRLLDLDFHPQKISLYKNHRLSVYGEGKLSVFKL